MISDFCKTWDDYDGMCLTCYKGYKLDEGECVPIESNLEVSDVGCKIWDW